jgi:hypothetical protein
MQNSFAGINLGGGLVYRKFTLTYADLTTAGTTQEVALFTLPAAGKILGTFIKQSVKFSGGSLSTMTVSVGITGTTTAFSTTHDIFAAVADTACLETSQFKATGLAAKAVVAEFTGSHNVNTATAGSVDIYVCYLNPATVP